MSNTDLSPDDIREMDKKEVRKQFPSGWMELTRYEAQRLAIDAALENPAGRQMTLQELADEAGVSEKGLNNRIGNLVDLGILRRDDNDGETTYSLRGNSPIVQNLIQINSLVSSAKEKDNSKNRNNNSTPIVKPNTPDTEPKQGKSTSVISSPLS